MIDIIKIVENKSDFIIINDEGEVNVIKILESKDISSNWEVSDYILPDVAYSLPLMSYKGNITIKDKRGRVTFYVGKYNRRRASGMEYIIAAYINGDEFYYTKPISGIPEAYDIVNNTDFSNIRLYLKSNKFRKRA